MNFMEDSVIPFVIAVLLSKPGLYCKSVIIANSIIDSFGLDSMKWIKTKYSGLLNMLSFFSDLFFIKRIPANDEVYLIASPEYVRIYYPDTRFFLNCNGFTIHSTCCLHIGCLYKSTTKQQLRELFGHYALVRNIRIRNGHARRYAFVEFFSKEDALKAKISTNRSCLWKGTLQFAKHEFE